jgi:predicted RNA-binding Zn-ribbon protein involved in translation (DUF1610 family)
MGARNRYGEIARELRGGRPRLATRLTVSFILACAAASAALLTAWSYAMFFPQMVSFPTTGPGVATTGPIRWYRVRDETVGAAFVVTGFVWLLLLWRLWRPIERGRAAIGTILFTLAMANVVFAAAVLCEMRVMRGKYRDELVMGVPLVIAVAATIAAWVRLYQRSSWKASAGVRTRIAERIAISGGLAGGTFGLAVVLDKAMRMEEEFVIGALVCASAGLLLFVWLPVIFASETRAVRSETGHVDIRCPKCGYSLIGLRELRCPECGEQFVLDELLERQGFLSSDQA